MPRFPLQSIDIFAGCGGLSTGLHLSGWQGLFAVERNPAAFSTLKANRLQKHLRCHTGRHSPDSHRFVNHTGEVEAVFARLLADAPRNRCIMGQAREPYGLKERSVTVLAGLQPAPTVPDDFVHYSEPRVMTVRECAPLQTFPDWFAFKGPYTTGNRKRVSQTPRYTQIGNAVPPLFAEIAGLALKKALGHG